MRKVQHYIYALPLLLLLSAEARAASTDWLARGRDYFMRQHYIESLDSFTRAMNAAWEEHSMLTYY